MLINLPISLIINLLFEKSMCYRPGTCNNANTKSPITQKKCAEICSKYVKITNVNEEIQSKLKDELQTKKYEKINESVGKLCAKVKPDVIQQDVKNIPTDQLTKFHRIPTFGEEQAQKCEEIDKSIGKVFAKEKPVIQKALVKNIPENQLTKSHSKYKQTDKSLINLPAKEKPDPILQQGLEKTIPGQADQLRKSQPIPIPQSSGNAAHSRSLSKNKVPLGKQINSIKDIFKPCDDCSQTHHINLQKLLKVCEENPDSIIQAYQKEHSKVDGKKKLEEEYSQIKLGETLGDAEYHYLMVDASTSTSTEKSDLTGVIQKDPTEKINAVPADLVEADSLSQVHRDDIEKVEENSLNESSTSWSPPKEVEVVTSKSFDEVDKDKLIRENSNVTEEHSTTDKSSFNLTENLSETPLFYDSNSKSKPESKRKILDTSLEKKDVELQPEQKSEGDTLLSLELIQRQTGQKDAVSLEDEDTEEEEAKDSKFDEDQTKVSFRDLGKANESPEQRALQQSKRRMEAKLANVIDQRKNLHKNSMLIDVVREEKHKSEIFLSLMDKSDDENDSISEKQSIEDSVEMEKKSKCCGLIKNKKKVPSTPKKNGPPKTSETLKKRSSDSISSNEENSEERLSSLVHYRRRSSPVEKPVFEKNQIINRYSHNL